MRTDGRYRKDILVQAILVINAIDNSGSRGLTIREIKDSLREWRRLTGMAPSSDDIEKCPAHRQALYWAQALEDSLIFEREKVYTDGGRPTSRIRRVGEEPKTLEDSVRLVRAVGLRTR